MLLPAVRNSHVVIVTCRQHHGVTVNVSVYSGRSQSTRLENLTKSATPDIYMEFNRLETYNPSRDYCIDISAGNVRERRNFCENISCARKDFGPRVKLGGRIDVLKGPDLIDLQKHKFCDLCVQALHKGTKLRATAKDPS